MAPAAKTGAKGFVFPTVPFHLGLTGVVFALAIFRFFVAGECSSSAIERSCRGA